MKERTFAMPIRMLGLCLALCALATAGCARNRSSVAVVNIANIEARWPKFINYSRQLQANLMAINESKISADQRRRELAQWQQQSLRWQDEVTSDVRDAVKQIATNRHYELVVTKLGVDYGGDDITTDVEKALGIDVNASPPAGAPQQ
jgi:Skp family chaperone for outer membrane proteins